MSREQIILVFPPVDCRVCDRPYWEPGYVSGYLRGHGYHTTFLDLNLCFFEHLFTLEKVDEAINLQSSLINHKSAKDRKWLESLYAVRDQLQSNLDIVRGRDGIPSYDEYRKALDSLEFLLGAYYQDDFPEQMKLDGYLPLQTNIMSGRQLINDVLSDNISTVFKYYDTYLSSYHFVSSPDLVVVWINYYYQLYSGLLFCRELRRHLEHVPISIVSNLLARSIPALEEYPEFSFFFDALILSDPEVVIPELLSWANGRTPSSKVPNSVIFSGSSFQTSNETAQSDLDRLETPLFPAASERRYFFPVPVFDIIGSRGCRYSQCAFCDDIGFAGYNKAPHRLRRPSLVVNDINNLATLHDCKSFLFWDNYLTPEFLEDLTDEIEKKPLDVIWGGHTRVGTVLRGDFCERLYQSGCRFLNIGFESASPRILRLMRKGVQIEEMEEALHNCSYHGIALHCTFIQGFPGERPEERLETARFIEKNLSKISSFHIYQFALPQFSTMARKPGHYGIRLCERPKDSLNVDRTYVPARPAGSNNYFDLSNLSRKYPEKRGDRVIYKMTCKKNEHLCASHD